MVERNGGGRAGGRCACWRAGHGGRAPMRAPYGNSGYLPKLVRSGFGGRRAHEDFCGFGGTLGPEKEPKNNVLGGLGRTGTRPVWGGTKWPTQGRMNRGDPTKNLQQTFFGGWGEGTKCVLGRKKPLHNYFFQGCKKRPPEGLLGPRRPLLVCC